MKIITAAIVLGFLWSPGPSDPGSNTPGLHSVPSEVEGQARPSAITIPARIDAKTVERFYNESIIKDGTIDPLVKQLAAMCADAARPRRSRANSCLLRSHLEWRHGRLPAALAAADAGLAVESFDDLVYHKARLLDASGRIDETREWYQKALAATTSPALKETIRLRLTFVDAVAQNVTGLVELARTRPADFRNRAAIALAVLDYDKEATSLYQVFGEGSELFRQHVRVAQWAIKAGDAAKAQDEAWKAVQAATMDRDRNYGLSLLVEAHALDKSLNRLLDRFGQQKTLTPEEQRVRIDLLRETGQYQKAIDLFTSAHGQTLGPEMRLELLRMYRDAGQDAAMIAEYRRLIASEPTLTDWVEGLSQYYLEQSDQPSARRLWEEFLARNTDVNTLLFGGDSMTAFGLHDLAVTAAEKALAHSTTVEERARVRLAQFEMYRRRGKNTEAEAALAALDQLLPAESAFRQELADAYERLQKPQLAAKVLQGLAAAPGGVGVDERMRLAWLLDSTGQRDAALAMWREIWNSESLAARRRLVEERLLMLAAELGTLGEIAVELEEKLANKTAAPRDVSLLVSIYTKVGDSVSAIEVVTAAAAQGGKNSKTEVESLKEQGQIYLALAEYPDFTRVMRRLMEIDPANKVDYLQSLLLNQIEAGSDSTREQQDATAQLREWLAQLRKVGGEAVGAEFEAGVLELAGFRDQALDAYRRALARHPERADDHLLLTELLRQAGRQAEGVASLQYIAESAESDELFLVAIDGITNMRTGNASTIKWAQRRALERLTERDDKIYLYEMLAELAEETRDAKMYIAALEASLAHADSRRSHVLRELLAVTAEVTTYEASQRVAGPDTAKNVAYARRLIALGEELPPDVYVDLGRTFIKLNDPDAARRAFSLAVDRTGRTSIVFEAGKLFERGGFDREAIREYERALVADAGNLETMVRLAKARERSGDVATANDLYLRALLGVVSRQNRSTERGQERTPPALTSLVTFEYRRYYSVLLAGYLSTLPETPEASAPRLKPVEDAFAAELRDVASLAGPARTPLAYYPRLAVLAGTVRAGATASGAIAAANRTDAALQQAFAHDPSVSGQVDEDRRSWGAPTRAADTATSSAAPPPDRVKDTADYLREITDAMGKGDQDLALTSYRQWARFAGSPKPPIMIGANQLPDRSPGIPEVATHAWQRLDAQHFGSLAHHILGLITDQDAYAEKVILDLIYQYEVPDVPILTRIETAIGQPLIAEERLLRIVSNRKDFSLLNFNYVLSHLSTYRQIELLDRYSKATDVGWTVFLKALGTVMAKPLDAAQATQLATMAKNALTTGLKRGSGMQLLPNFMNYPFTAGIDPSNAPIVEDIERAIAEKYPQVFKVGYFRATMLRDLGRDQEALPAFVDAALQMYVPLPQPVNGVIMISSVSGAPTPYAYQSFVRSFAPFIYPKYKADVMKLLDEREANGVTDALISLRVELNSIDPSGDVRQFAAALQAVADRHPKNEQVRLLLQPLYDQVGDTMKSIAVVTELTRLRPENRDYQYRLVLLWQRLEYPENAAKATGGKPIQDFAPVVQRNTYIESISGPPAVRFPSLKRAHDAVKAGVAGGDPVLAAMGLRTLLQTLPPGGMSTSEFAQTRDAEDPYLYMRDFLNLEAEAPPKPAPSPAGTPPPTPAPANTYDRLIRSLEMPAGEPPPVRAGRMPDVLGRFAFSIAPIESYLSTLRTVDIDRQYVFFMMLIDAWVSGGKAEDELQRRTPQVLAREIGQKDATIWLGLAARQPAARAAELVQTAERGGLHKSAESALARLLLARLYVTAGQPAKALETYVGVAVSVLAGSANTLQPNTLATDPFARDNSLFLFTGLGLFDEVRQRLNAEGLNTFVAGMLDASRPPASPGMQQTYSRFVNVMYVRALKEGLTLPALKQEAATITVGPGWSRSEILQLAFIRAHMGRTDDALNLVKTTIRRDFDSRELISAALSNAIFAARQYQIALGTTGDVQMLGPFATSGAYVEEFKPLFPVKADEWAGGDAWVARMAAELPVWIEQGTVNRDAGMQVLCLVALRLRQHGQTAGAQAAARYLSTAFRAGPVSVKASTLAASVAELVGAPIDLPILQDLVRTNRLHLSRAQSVIARTVTADGPAAALQLGEAAAQFTSNDELIKQLIAIAKAAGNAEQTARWTTRQQEANAARAVLAGKPATIAK